MPRLAEPNLTMVLPLDPACLVTPEQRRAVAKLPPHLRRFLDGALADLEPWEVAEAAGVRYTETAVRRICQRLGVRRFLEAVAVYAFAKRLEQP